MVRKMRKKFYATREQLIYAAVLDLGMKIGLGLLVVSFALYVSRLVPPHVPFERLSELWGRPTAEYLAATGTPSGWGWLGLAFKGDYMSFIGIAFLSAVTIACYLRIIVYPWRDKDWLTAAIIAGQALVLGLGASGILVAGH